jgi:hypothetical protein
MSKLGSRLIKAAKEARAIARSEITDGFVVRVPDEVDVKALRKKLKCFQSELSRRSASRNERDEDSTGYLYVR